MLLSLYLGLFFVLIGLFKLGRIYAAKNKNKKATGIILSHNDFLGSLKYNEDDPYPVVQYATATGKTITETYFVSSKYYTIGAKVIVYYNPANPKRFIIFDWVSLLTPCILIFFGILSILLFFFLPGR